MTHVCKNGIKTIKRMRDVQLVPYYPKEKCNMRFFVISILVACLCSVVRLSKQYISNRGF